MSDSLEGISHSQPITAQEPSKEAEPIENSKEAEQIQNQALSSSHPSTQGPDLTWNFDGMEDKNPFSGFSEEHLNKLDEVLSSAGVQELLQQSSPGLNFLHLDGTEQLAGGSEPTGHAGEGDTVVASTSGRRDSSDSLPESIISVVFSDHGYCMNPEKVSTQKPKVATTQPTTNSLPVMVAVEQSGSSIPINAVPTALTMTTDSEAENTDSKMESPTTSPRKSGRAHTRSKYLDEDWITQGSPSRGRGRGRGVDTGMPVPFGFRASTRISDQKQRDLAEKIMLANRQAMEAEMDTEETDQSESPVKIVPKGRGRGRGQTSPAGRVGGTSQSSQEESSQDESQDDDDDDDENEDDDNNSEQSESEDEKKKPKKGGKKNTKGGKKKKKGGKYEDDSDYSAGEDKNTKNKTKGKKKVKNESEDEEVSDVKTKKGKKKKVTKAKKKAKPKGKKGKKKGAKAEKKPAESEDESETEVKKKSEEKSPKKKAKKLSKKQRLKKMKEAKEAKKAKLLEKKKEKKKDKKKKGKETETEAELSDVSPKKKALKKGKAAVGKKKMGTEDESTDASPKKKTKVNETKAAENKSPKVGEKRKASPARAAKNKTVSPVSTPTKKQKMAEQKKTVKKSKAEVTDSEDDKPLKPTKANSEKDTKPSQETPQNTIHVPVRGDQNIFASLAMGFMADDDVKDTAANTADIVTETKQVTEDTELKTDKNKSESVELVNVNDKKVIEKNKKSADSVLKNNNKKEEKVNAGIEVKAESLIEGKELKDAVNSDSLKGKETCVKTNEEKLDKEVAETSVSVEQLTDINKLKDDKGQSGTHKRHDSEDSRGSSHHHHHHHHHRKHSHDRQDSVSEDRSDSGNHRQESRDRKDSADRRHSQDRDRRSSRSHRDRDRHGSRKSSDSSDKSRKDSSSGLKDSAKKSEGVSNRRESVGSVSSDTSGKNAQSGQVLKKDGKLGKDGKVKGKKSKKSDEVPIDSSMADLFMPDNLPPPSKEEVNNKQTNEKDKKSETSQEKERVSKVSFKDDLSSKKSKTEKEEVVGPEVISLNSDSSAENSKDSQKVEDPKAVKKSEEASVTVVNVAKDKKDKTSKSDVKKDSKEVEKDSNKLDKKSEKVDKGNKESKTSVSMDVDIETVDETKDGIKIGTGLKEEEKEVKTGDMKGKDNTEEKMDINEEASVKLETDTVKTEPELAEKIPAGDKSEVEDSKETKKEEKKESVTETVTTPVKRKIKNPLKMSDFFSERRLKINDPKPRVKVVKEEITTTEESDGADEGSGRKRRNKAKALSEILKKEKLGSDDEGESDSDFEDDENDEDFEDPDQLYCICRQPHNQRFMICCDKCEEWFHGKCVGITRARGAEMEKNNEEYVCPQCNQSEIQDKNVASTTQSPEQVAKKGVTLKNTDSGSSSSEVIKPDSTMDKDKETSQSGKDKSSAIKAPGEATPKSEKVKKFVIVKSKQSGETTPKSGESKEQELTPKQKSDKGQITSKSDGKSKDKHAVSTKKRTDSDLSEKRKRMIRHMKEESTGKDKTKQTYNKCFTCNVKTPRKDSLYCSDDCRAKHSKHNVVPGILKNKDKKEKKKERHIAVVEPSTGRTLTGEKAPAESELKTWLEENPTFEILKSHNKPAQRTPDQKSDSKDSSKSSKGDKSKKSEGPEPIRLNVRKGLRDALAARAESADDVMLSSSEIKGVAMSVEEELFKYFKDTDHKYKAKYRSLIFNIKDQKNKGLFRKILTGRVRASKLVRMTADELANRELAQWREHENKHTLEMIKQTEREHMKEPVHVMKKTHKGEEEVQDEEGEDLSTLANEPKKKEETTKHDNKEDDQTENLPDTTDTHGQHLFDANCKICTGKLVPAAETTPTKAKAVKTETTKTKRDEKELTKKERDLQADEVVKEVLKAIQRAKDDERKEELEAQQRSAVTVRSPDSALSSGLDKNVKFTPIGPMLWKGFIYMQDVSKFVTTAYRVTGPADHLSIPDTITLCGRISPEHVWDYLNKVKQSATRDICVVRFIPGVNEEKAAYINLYSYLNSRSRCGVVEHKAKNIKDFYIVPLASHSKIPSVLLPFDGPGLEENRCHMLLGVIIRNKVDHSKSSHSRHSHRSSKSSKSQPLKSVLKDPFEPESPDKSSSSSPRTSSSSSTPQTSVGDKKKAISFDPIVKEYSHVTEQDDSYEPGSDYPLDLNAPYDPEKEALKEPATPKPEKSSKADPVTLMMEKIAQSKNPAEATAAMVAALATTSKLGNQRKLLLELTKKVDEQKRLLEQKRISTKLGQSPSGNSPGPSSTTAVTSTSFSSIGISSKDPRLRAKTAAAEAANAASNIDKNDNSEEQMDIDLRVPAPTGVPAPVGVPPPSGSSSIALTPSKPASVLPPSITTSALEKSMSILSSLTSDIASDAASPSVKSQLSASKETVVSSSVLGADKDDVKSKLAQSGAKSDPLVKPKGFYIDHGEVEEKSGSNKVVSDSVTVKANKTTSKNSDGSEKSTNSAQHEIVSQLMAEVSGKSLTDTKTVKTDTDSEIQDESQKSKPEEKDQTEQSSKQVPNVAALFKGLANTGAGNSDAGKKAGIQLPSALMSLFSKLPGSAEEPQEEAPAKIPGLFTAESEELVEDTDLRQPSSSATQSQDKTSVTEGNNKEEVKDTEDKLSKSFMGFDYDSDSSGGSFEGFDDDGTKKLSPRKRKYIQKSPHTQSPSTKTNLFGDVDERGTPPVEDVDLREQVEDDVDLRHVTDNQQKDIDDRIALHMAGTSGQPLPPGEGPLHPFPPPGLRLPFISSSQPLPPGTESSQPLPPGVDWKHLAATNVPAGMQTLPPPAGEWGPPPLPEVSQPPLPAEPPKPKPPEPPMKKKKDEEGIKRDDDNSDNDGETKYQSKNSKKKKKKKERKNKKNGQQLSDERIQQIVLEIAKNEPIEPPPLPPMVPPMHGMQYGPPPPMMPIPPPMGVPMPPCGPPVTSQLMPHMDIPSIGNSTWMNPAAPGPGLNAQSQMVPPHLPPHMQPGVVPNKPPMGPVPDSLGHMRYMDQPHVPKGQSRKESSSKPPSLLDLPLAPPSKLIEKAAESTSNSRSGSPSIRDARCPNEEQTLNEPEQNVMQADIEQREQVSESVSQGVAVERSKNEEERSRDRDRDERRRRDGQRSRSRDRSRRSRSGERSYRSRSREREADYHHRERSYDRDHHHYRDRRRGDHRSRDRDHRSGRSHRH